MRSPTLAIPASSVSTWPWAHLHANCLPKPCRIMLSAQPRLRPLPPVYHCATRNGDDNSQVERSLGDSSTTEFGSTTLSTETYEQVMVLGRSHATAGNPESAVHAFEHAVALEPRSASARADLGRALVRSGQRSKGFDSLVAAFEIDSFCPGVKDGFREYYEAEIKANPADIDLHEGLAALYVDSGLAEEAAACYRRCLELSSPSPSGSSSPVVADAARIDRWSVALFKCHTSVCYWDSWRTEAKSLQEAVRRCQPGSGSTAPPHDAQDNSDRNELLWSGFDSPGVFTPESPGDESGSAVVAKGSTEDTMSPGAAAAATSALTNFISVGGTSGEQSSDGGSSVGNGVIGTKTDDFAASHGVGRYDAISLPPLHPFDSLSAPLSIGDCLAVAQQQSTRVLAEGRAAINTGCHERMFKNRRTVPYLRDRNTRIRLGYMSGDLMGTHPLTHLMQSVFGMHDRDEFEVFLYALNPDDGSHRRRRMEREVEHFRDVSALTAREAAAAIAEDGICVLVNLNGYAGTAKSADVFALRPAPVTISYMGFPGTMGSPEMVDYILADGIVIPCGMRPFYSEKVLEMPHCYFVNDYRQSERDVVEQAPVQSREEYGLPPGGDVYDVIACSMSESGKISGEDWGSCSRAGVSEGVRGVHVAGDVGEGRINVVLCNFNRLHKIDPYTFDAWMEVLRNVPGTVLWLLDGGATARANVRRYAGLAGVEEDRIVFAPLVGKTDHLRRLRLADVFVDTPLYNAHTVGCDALWAGVPMVTLRGTKMASRVGASLVEAAGIPELVTESMPEYVRLVENLARDGRRRRSLRLKLERSRLTCPLFDTRRWVRGAERLIRWARERHEAGLPPEHHRAGEMSRNDAEGD